MSSASKLRIAAVAALFIAVLTAQTEAPVFRENTRIVLLDIVVTDKSGHPLRDLRQQDFTVSEDGIAQRILSFEPPRNGAGDSVPAGSFSARAKQDRPRTIILMDELNTDFRDLAFARYSVSQMFQSGRLAGYPVAVMAIGRHGLSMVRDFTTDPVQLCSAIASMRAAPEAGENRIDLLVALDHANQALAALEQIARAAVGYPFRLNVLWITDGFPGLIKPGAVPQDYTATLRGMANLLLKSRLNLYTVDPSGLNPEASAARGPLQHDPRESDVSFAQRQAAQALSATNAPQLGADQLLSVMTNDMGGASYFNRNDVGNLVAQAIADGSSAYTLTYSPSNTNFDGRYRTIAVRVDRPAAFAAHSVRLLCGCGGSCADSRRGKQTSGSGAGQPTALRRRTPWLLRPFSAAAPSAERPCDHQPPGWVDRIQTANPDRCGAVRKQQASGHPLVRSRLAISA